MKSTYLALLRGVNVGGKNKLPMKDLCNALSKDGFGDLRSFIQSGNLIFSAERDSDSQSLASAISALIEKQFGLKIPTVIRNTAELSQVLELNPYKNADANLQYIMFLQHAPANELVACLDAQKSPPDEFKVQGQEIYLLLKNGAARTKLTNIYFDSKLRTISTLPCCPNTVKTVTTK